MDINDIRIAVTVISLLLFSGLVVHTWSRGRRKAHEEASRLVFEGEGQGENGPTVKQGRQAS